MKISVFDNSDLLSRYTAKLIINIVNNKPDVLLCFAAGHTQLKTYKYLTEYFEKGEVSFSNCTFLGLDEWEGMGKEDRGSCTYFMYRNVFEPLKIRDDQIVFFNAKAKKLEAECERINNFLIENGPIDLVLLGVGMNGHIGLNEPGTSPDLDSHIVVLDQVTKRVGQKYFDKHVKLERGVTLGLKQIMLAQKVVLMVSGRHKSEIVKKLLEENNSSRIPAAIFKRHKDAVLFIDKDAASLLGQDKEVFFNNYDSTAKTHTAEYLLNIEN